MACQRLYRSPKVDGFHIQFLPMWKIPHFLSLVLSLRGNEVLLDSNKCVFLP